MIARATEVGLYTNLITSAVGLTRDKLAALADAGLCHVQISFQGAEATLADRVGGYFRPRLPKRANPIELRLEAPGAGPTVVGDPVLLEWALESLVKNAIDALQGRGGTIILRVGADVIDRDAAPRIGVGGRGLRCLQHHPPGRGGAGVRRDRRGGPGPVRRPR